MKRSTHIIINSLLAATSILSSIYMFINGMVWLGIADILIAGGFIWATVLRFLEVE